MSQSQMNQLAINTLRVHAIQMVEDANSGHPGMALDAAPLMWTLYDQAMQHNPGNPHWANRDRFVLSAGHASALLYSTLNLMGYDLTREDLENFRQLGSRTPGHPEISVTPGVEVSTGPLGQGIAMGVGLALAESILAAKFNRPGHEIVDHYTFVLHGDGCPQEGVASEAASFAGHQKLGKLINIYDRNAVTIDGGIDLSFTEDLAERYRAYGWQVLNVDDANDIDAFAKAIEEAKKETERPSLIIVCSEIGYASPLVGQSKSHGAPLGSENLAKTKAELAWPEDKSGLDTCRELLSYMKERQAEYAKAEAAWQQKFDAWSQAFPELRKEWDSYRKPDFSALREDDRFFTAPEKAEATRSSSGKILNLIAEHCENFIGGSADLAGSNKTWLKDKGTVDPTNRNGQNINYGIREFAMSCIMNGLLLHGGLRAFCATFFTFSDYMRSGIRSSALMCLPAIYVLTHDSIGVGEDGPTHQPIEHLSSFRAMPGILTFRPADYLETSLSYLYALESARPSLMVLSRQNLEQIDLPAEQRPIEKGAYIVKDMPAPQLILLASGSELSLVLEVQESLAKDNISSRVVSVPCMELFLEQDKAYRNEILPPSCRKRLAIEAAAPQSWYQLVGLDGKVHGITEFGASAPADKLFEKFGFTVDNLVQEAKELLED